MTILMKDIEPAFMQSLRFSIDFTTLSWEILLYVGQKFSNMKSFLGHREENMKWFLWGRINYNPFLEIPPKYSEGTWKNWLQSISILAINNQRWMILVSLH